MASKTATYDSSLILGPSKRNQVCSCYTRRGFLGNTLSIASAATASLLLPGDGVAGKRPVQSELRTYNGGADPYPIPWLDKNGSHNQPAGSTLEPSHIYHFKGESPGAPILFIGW